MIVMKRIMTMRILIMSLVFPLPPSLPRLICTACLSRRPAPCLVAVRSWRKQPSLIRVYQSEPTIMFYHGPCWLNIGHLVSINIKRCGYGYYDNGYSNNLIAMIMPKARKEAEERVMLSARAKESYIYIHI